MAKIPYRQSPRHIPKPGKPSYLYYAFIVGEEKVRDTRERTSGIRVRLWSFIHSGLLYFSLLLVAQMIGLQYSVCLLDALFASQPPCHILPRLALTTHLLLLPFLDKFLVWQLKSFPLVFSFMFLRYPIRLGTTFLSPAWIPTTSPMFQSTSNIFKHIRKI